VQPPNRQDVLMYTGALLDRDIEVSGAIRVGLSVSSSCRDTDFTAKLIDVTPDGSRLLVADGITRAMYRDSTRQPMLMVPGVSYGVNIALGDLSYVFRAGHRIQVDVSSSNFPRHARNTNSGNVNYTKDGVQDFCVATNSIHHDGNKTFVSFAVRGAN